MVEIVCKEQYGSTGEKFIYSRNPGSHLLAKGSDTKHPRKPISSLFKSVFLPQGFPESVSSDYVPYQLWDSLQALMSSLVGTLATQAVLTGMGVGDANATPMAATITWLLKDGSGMIGRIWFAWLKGTSLDSECKRWRLFADAVNDCALFFELLGPYFLTLTTWILCFSGILKSLVGVAGGATRAAFVQHQALRGNFADVEAKDGSQETLVNLVGLILSLLLIPFVSGNSILIWSLYVIFTSIHLFSNYCAVRSLVITSLNEGRLSILVTNYLRGNKNGFSPVDVNNQENIILSFARNNWKIKLGCSLNKSVTSEANISNILSICKGCNYLINLDNHKREIYISLHNKSDEKTQLEAYFHAEVLKFCLTWSINKENYRKNLRIIDTLQTAIENCSHGDDIAVLRNSRKVTYEHFPIFYDILQCSTWKTDRVLLNADEWRYSWPEESLHEKSV